MILFPRDSPPSPPARPANLPDDINPSTQEPFNVQAYLRKEKDDHQQADDPDKQIQQI
jgi:hypothetical protein